MNQQTTISHHLEKRQKPSVFSSGACDAGMYAEARKLAHEGRIQAALDRAYDIHVENYGDCRGIEFRVVTKIVTVSMLTPWDEFLDVR